MVMDNNLAAPDSIELIDIGANLTNRSFKNDLEAVIKDSKDASVSHIIVTGTSPQQSIKAVELVVKFPEFLYSTAGCHPHDAKDFIESDISLLRKLSKKSEVVAIGECGLDFNRNFSPQDVQIKVFKQQLSLAAELAMPVFLHQRDAHETFVEILKQYRQSLTRVVIHCFTDGPDELEDYLALDCHIGVTGWVCDDKRGKQLQHAVPLIPDEKLMLETDAPYLMPKTIKAKPGKSRNEPANLIHVCNKVAELRNIDTKHIAQLTARNSKKFFKL